ncbi:MAG: lysoplasmalogenase family protein [Candidatus Hermodarchaeota archaeon]|nr:lysoplasmalogenase family protein [Candidatus Hermodarchaeota archaeon]
MSSKSRALFFFRKLYLIMLLIIIIAYFGMRALYEIYALGDLTILQWNFLTVSILIAFLAFFNYIISIYYDQVRWQPYTLLLFIAMIFGSLGDFLLGGFVPLPIEPLILGTVAFAIGQVFYLVAMRNLSPLLISTNTSSEDTTSKTRTIVFRNFIIWLAFILFGIALFILTVFNPSELEISIGALCYGLLFLSVIGFALTKFLDDYPILFRGALFIGLLLFFISDYVLIINRLTTPILYAGLIITVTYIIGQCLIHLTPLLIGKSK